MAEAVQPTRDAPPRAGMESDDAEYRKIDWIAAERSPEFRKLIRIQKRFVIPVTIFFLAWYFGFILLAGYAPSFMGESIYQGFTVGYALALSQFVMVWTLGWVYLRKADRDFDPLRRAGAQAALHADPIAIEDTPSRQRPARPPRPTAQPHEAPGGAA